MDQLRERYGFECMCPACNIEAEFGKASAVRRKKLEDLDGQLTRLLKSGAVHPGDETICVEMLSLMDEEGMKGWENGQM